MTDNNPKYFPLWQPPLSLPDYYVPQWVIDLIDKSGDEVFEIMVEQMRVNPDAIEALYG
jgi:hypothetical protein